MLSDTAQRNAARVRVLSARTLQENAVKIARAFTKRQSVICFEHAYHGDTFGAMSVSARGTFTQPYEKFLFEVERLPFPEPGREGGTLEAFARLLQRRPDGVAALIVEPLVLGAGGMKMYGPAVLRS